MGSEIRLWRVAIGKPLLDFSDELDDVGHLRFSGEGCQLIAIGKTREKHTGIIAWGGRVPIVRAE